MLPRPSGSRSRRLSGVVRLFDARLDRGALERMLLAAATHARGPGFVRAHLLVWNPDRGTLDGRLSWVGGVKRTWDQSLLHARQQASDGTDPIATKRLRPLQLDPAKLEGALAKAWTSRQTDLGENAGNMPWSDSPAIGAIALVGPSYPVGLVVGEWATSADIAERGEALESYRVLANAALALHLDAERARRSVDHAAALAAFAQTAVASVNLAELGNALVRLVAQSTNARGAVLYRVTEKGTMDVSSSFGPAGSRDRLGRGLTPVAMRSVVAGRPWVIERAVEAEMLEPEIAAQVSAVSAAPIMAYGRVLGALLVYDRLVQHPNESTAFDGDDLALVSGLASQCALAFEQARGEEARHQLEQARRDLLRRLMRIERQAEAGEISTRAAQQARNPLAAIGAFARRVHRSLGEADPNREYLEVVIRETERLEHVLAEPIEGPTPEGPRLKMESMNQLMQQSLQKVGEQLVRRRVRLLKKLSPDLPPLLLDAKRMSRVIDNVLGHALERIHPGGRIRVESRRLQQFVVVEIASDASAQPGDMLNELFVPFGTRSSGSSDVGLGTARQVVWQHGGEVRIRSEAEWTLIFTLTLPIRTNEDRRRPGAERRIVRGDRRQHAPA